MQTPEVEVAIAMLTPLQLQLQVIAKVLGFKSRILEKRVDTWLHMNATV